MANANASELDFFGFDAAGAAASVKKPVEKKPKQRERKMSVDMVPKWAGNEDAASGKKKSGSKQSRKRKLSEGAIEEQKLEDDERKQASMLLAPPKMDKAQKRKLKKQQRRARAASIGSEASSRGAEDSNGESDDDEDEDEDDDEDEDMTLFKNDNEDDEVETDGKSKKSKKAAKQEATVTKEKEEITLFRKQMNIRVDGTAVPAPIAEFSLMRLNARQEKMKGVLLKNIEASEYKEPTPIQMQAIPSMLLGRDVLATAPTGSGKTAAFAIPMLANLGAPAQERGIRAIVLSPTRELSVQIYAEFNRLSKGRKFHIVLLSKATAATIAAQIKYVPKFILSVMLAFRTC